MRCLRIMYMKHLVLRRLFRRRCGFSSAIILLAGFLVFLSTIWTGRPLVRIFISSILNWLIDFQSEGKFMSSLHPCLHARVQPLLSFDPYAIDVLGGGIVRSHVENRFQEVIWDTFLDGTVFPVASDMAWELHGYGRGLLSDLELLQRLAATKTGPAQWDDGPLVIQIRYVHLRLDRLRGLQFVVNYDRTSFISEHVANMTYTMLVNRPFDTRCYVALAQDNIPGTSEEIVYILLPYHNRPRRLRSFISHIFYLRQVHGVHVELIISLIQSSHADTIVFERVKADILSTYPEHTDAIHMVYNLGDENGKFSRAEALRAAANHVRNNNSVLFQCDVDMRMTPGFLRRCRHNARKGHQAYFPVFYSLYSHASVHASEGVSISQQNGFWRTSSFGMACIRKGDFNDIHPYDDARVRFHGWGGEDVYQFEQIRNMPHMIAFRAVDPGLFHRWHLKDCNVSSIGYKSCMKTNFLTIGHPMRLGALLLQMGFDANTMVKLVHY